MIGGVIERAPLVSRDEKENHLDNDSVVRIWDQEVYFFVVSGSSHVVAHMMATEGLHGC